MKTFIIKMEDEIYRMLDEISKMAQLYDDEDALNLAIRHTYEDLLEFGKEQKINDNHKKEI